MMSLLEQFSVVFIFLVLAAAFVTFNLMMARFLRPRVPSADKYIPYECGERPTGHSWVQFNNRFFTIALIFILFEVEILFMFPWGAIFKSAVENGDGILIFTEMFVFMLILLVALAYVWRKGDLEWIKDNEQVSGPREI